MNEYSGLEAIDAPATSGGGNMNEYSGLEAIDAPATTEWFCDQCGRRYPGPGLCDAGHPPTVLKELAVDTSEDAVPAEAAVSVDAHADAVGATKPVEASVAEPGAKNAIVSSLQAIVAHGQQALDALNRF